MRTTSAGSGGEEKCGLERTPRHGTQAQWLSFGPTWQKKIIVPDRSNRSESIEFIWQRLHLEEAAERDIGEDVDAAQGYMAARRAPQVAMAVADV